MKKALSFSYYIYLLLCTLTANSFILISAAPQLVHLLTPLFLFINVLAGTIRLKTKCKRLKICYHGAILLSVFAVSVFISVIYHIVLAFLTIPDNYTVFLWSALICVGIEAFLFWNGILCVYFTSIQLGIKQRIIGAVCGMIPVANIVVLNAIIKTVLKEVQFEIQKEQINCQRKSQQVCKTKYPILMVHGVFFRDNKYFNYWGRIPKELERNGAAVFYGNHQSAASVADSAAELMQRIEGLVSQLGCQKVNIIAHSKGGLDCRYALAHLGAAPYVASLTTINTPHRGCLFADYLLTKIPDEFKNKVASTYNTTLRKIGDPNPDFLAAINNLTDAFCTSLDSQMQMPDGVFFQSVGSVMPKASSGNFPLNFSYHLVKYFDGINDGLVSEKSFQWGENYTLLSPKQNLGISHADMIDLTRRNIKGFDVREFYVGLVSDLKKRGL